jgi:Rieske 2Fe-2S family protein
VTDLLQSATHSGYFTLLPRDKYLDPQVFEDEYRKVFSRQWLFAGHISQLAQPGFYFVEEILGESVILTKTQEGEVRAFLNVCRHRGHRVCEGTSGRTQRFVCGYHRWSYALSGKLLGAPAMPDGDGGVDYRDLSLFDVHVTVYHGLIFVCLGAERPADLASQLADKARGIERFRLEHTKEAFRETYNVRANWKVLLENYLECHHCAGSHRELCKAMDLGAMFEETEGWVGEYFGGSTPLKETALTASLDGHLLSTPLGDADPVNRADVEGTGFGIVPTLTRVIVHIDHVLVHALRPVSPEEVSWQTRWFVKADAVEGADYHPDRLTEVWRATNGQDVALCQAAYKGVRSRRFVSGPLHATREAAIRSALATYTDMMSAAG